MLYLTELKRFFLFFEWLLFVLTFRVIAVGISDRVNETQLEIIATGSGSSNVHTVENFADLPVVVPAVVDVSIS